MKFEAVGLTATDLMPFPEFMTQAKDAYCYLRLGLDVLNKTPEELAAAFQESVDKDPDGVTMLEGISCFKDVADWFAGFSQVLETVVARSFIAASVIAERQKPGDAGLNKTQRQEEQSMSTPYDFGRMASVTDHRDADLLADLAKLTEIYHEFDLARRRGNTALSKILRECCNEGKTLLDSIAATPALTSEGRRAKALHALRDADPDLPCGGYTGLSALGLSALHDILQAGAL